MILPISSTASYSMSNIFRNPPFLTSKHIFTKDGSKSGKNSFTSSQVKNHLMQNGFKDIKRLRLDDKGIWRALVEFEKRHVLISVDYSGAIHVQDGRYKYD